MVQSINFKVMWYGCVTAASVSVGLKNLCRISWNTYGKKSRILLFLCFLLYVCLCMIYTENVKSCQHYPRVYCIYCIIRSHGAVRDMLLTQSMAGDDDHIDHQPYLSTESACVQVRGCAASL